MEYLFGNAKGNDHNIERTNQMANELKKIGIEDSPENRQYISDKIKESYYDDNSIYGVETRSYVAKELPNQPTISWEATTRDAFVMGPDGGVLMQTVWHNNVLKTIIVKGGKSKK